MNKRPRRGQVTERDVSPECSYADAFGRAVLYCLCKK
ncbi:hypothetical protein [Escherichia phage phiWAO78-1]|nr:hypothetical protein [Escherichia phage phiWAO78-1]DAU29099.1 MAG TPA: hypothetical protein [Caudoviricetes sp.]